MSEHGACRTQGAYGGKSGRGDRGRGAAAQGDAARRDRGDAAEMVRIGGGEQFAAAMQDVAQWGEVTLIVHTDDAIFEFTGAIPAGEIGRGYFNLMQPKGLHGHLRHERCAAVAFVERPFMGKSSAFIAFINVDGGIMFKVFVGRDETRALRADQLERFRALADRSRRPRRPEPFSAVSAGRCTMQHEMMPISGSERGGHDGVAWRRCCRARRLPPPTTRCCRATCRPGACS